MGVMKKMKLGKGVWLDVGLVRKGLSEEATFEQEPEEAVV